ncbi:MAG: hypothetical protein MI741_15595 [Rhodospirillales bacterium]|nr:hypothetical protein [Rhodospirillales bacterium]
MMRGKGNPEESTGMQDPRHEDSTLDAQRATTCKHPDCTRPRERLSVYCSLHHRQKLSDIGQAQVDAQSIDGIGTRILQASRPIQMEDKVYVDVVKTFSLLYFPIKTTRVLHANVDESGVPNEITALDSRGRVIPKAFMRSWGNLLCLFDGLTFLLAGLAFATMERTFVLADLAILVSSFAVLLLGVILRYTSFRMDRYDHRIKRIIGQHMYGMSDPLYWVEETAENWKKEVLTDEVGKPLLQLAEEAMSANDYSKAMICIRLAMKEDNTCEKASRMLDDLLADV